MAIDLEEAENIIGRYGPGLGKAIAQAMIDHQPAFFVGGQAGVVAAAQIARDLADTMAGVTALVAKRHGEAAARGLVGYFAKRLASSIPTIIEKAHVFAQAEDGVEGATRQ